MPATYIPPLSLAGEAAARSAADAALQAQVDALEAAGATDAELAAAVALKQDALTAATDAELAAAVATLNAAIAAKQSAADAATDAELAAHAADTTAVHGIADTADLILEGDARLSDDRDPTAHTHPQADVDGLDAALTDAKARANHTGTQSSATISDFTEAVQDAVAALLGAGSNITLTYDDAADSLTIEAAGGAAGLDAEAVRDAIGVALIGTGLISVAVNDAADTITISTTATANDTNANLRDRATHTGAQAIATVTGLQAALDALQPLNANLTAFAALAPANDDVVQRKAGAWTNRTMAQVKTDLALAKGDVGLGNVDNTADAAKAVAGDVTGTLAASVVTKVRGKAVPAPGVSENGFTWVYDHATGAMVWTALPTGGGASVVVLGADVTNSSTAIADVTGLSFAVLANTRYWFRFFITFTTAVSSTGSRWAVNGPSSPTSISYTVKWATSASAENYRVTDVYDLNQVSISSASGINACVIEGILINGVTGGTLIARFASEISASAVVAKAGSFVEYRVLA